MQMTIYNVICLEYHYAKHIQKCKQISSYVITVDIVFE